MSGYWSADDEEHTWSSDDQKYFKNLFDNATTPRHFGPTPIFNWKEARDEALLNLDREFERISHHSAPDPFLKGWKPSPGAFGFTTTDPTPHPPKPDPAKGIIGDWPQADNAHYAGRIAPREFHSFDPLAGPRTPDLDKAAQLLQELDRAATHHKSIRWPDPNMMIYRTDQFESNGIHVKWITPSITTLPEPTQQD